MNRKHTRSEEYIFYPILVMIEYSNNTPMQSIVYYVDISYRVCMFLELFTIVVVREDLGPYGV